MTKNLYFVTYAKKQKPLCDKDGRRIDFIKGGRNADFFFERFISIVAPAFNLEFSKRSVGSVLCNLDTFIFWESFGGSIYPGLTKKLESYCYYRNNKIYVGYKLKGTKNRSLVLPENNSVVAHVFMRP